MLFGKAARDASPGSADSVAIPRGNIGRGFRRITRSDADTASTGKSNDVGCERRVRVEFVRTPPTLTPIEFTIQFPLLLFLGPRSPRRIRVICEIRGESSNLHCRLAHHGHIVANRAAVPKESRLVALERCQPRSKSAVILTSSASVAPSFGWPARAAVSVCPAPQPDPCCCDARPSDGMQ
jgi:hypothetical protein